MKFGTIVCNLGYCDFWTCLILFPLKYKNIKLYILQLQLRNILYKLVLFILINFGIILYKR